ncbi:hypothetical protein [Methanobacterium aggregans]
MVLHPKHGFGVDEKMEKSGAELFLKSAGLVRAGSGFNTASTVLEELESS